MRVLDLFSGAGGAGAGYAAAGFEVTGWDIDEQPSYPFRFHRGDALTLDMDYLRSFDFIHASPPCKLFTPIAATIRPGATRKHPVNLIPETRALLSAAGVPCVIENVPEAPLEQPVILCGSMFGLLVRRHRGFELGGWKTMQPACRHREQAAASPGYPVKRYHSGQPRVTMSKVVGVFGRGQGLGAGEVDLWRRAMGIPWMTREELREAIPPAYTRWIAEQWMAGHDDRS